MRTFLLAAAAAAALAVPAAAEPSGCQEVADLPGANSVQTCSWRVWEYSYFTYGCAVDTNLDGQAEAECEPLFVVVIPG